MPAPNLPPGFDFTDPDVYAERLPVEELAELRRTAPVWWNEQPHGAEAFGDGGYWLVTRHADVREVSLRDDLFSSAANCIVPRYPDEESGRGQIEAGRFSMINMDAPQHSRLRKIISRGFTPRAIERLRDGLRRPPATSPSRPPRRVPVTSFSRSPPSCRCTPSPICLACRTRTA